MRTMLRQYRQFFALPDVARIVAISTAARLPLGMMSFAMLMYLRDMLGSFAIAGTVVGSYFIAMAATAPVQGRLIDRNGPRWPLRVTGVVHPAALLALFLAAQFKLGFSAALICAIVAGAFVTPINTISRTLWRHRFEDGADRRTAFAVDSVAIELNFTIGPALIALLLVVASSSWAFGFAVLAAALAALGFLRSPGFKYWRNEPHADRHFLGPLTIGRLWIVFACNFGLTFSFGVLEVSYAGFATGAGVAALAGLLLAFSSVGSALGGALYGGLRLRAPLEHQFTITLTFMALLVGLHALVASPWLMAPLAFATGLLIAPGLTAQTLLISRLAPQKYATEAFTWSSTFIVSGIGMGTAVAGWMIEKSSVPAAFLAGASSLALAALLALTMRVPDTADTVIA